MTARWLAVVALTAGVAGAHAASRIPDVATTATQSAMSPLVGTGRVTRAADGLFYVDAKVNGRSIRFLVDTGASVLTLTAADAAAAGVVVDRAAGRGRVHTAAGTAPMAWARVASVEVAGRRASDVRAAVIARGLHVSLLGQDMLARLGPVTIDRDALTLG